MAEQKYLRDKKWLTIEQVRDLDKKNKKTSKEVDKKEFTDKEDNKK